MTLWEAKIHLTQALSGLYPPAENASLTYYFLREKYGISPAILAVEGRTKILKDVGGEFFSLVERLGNGEPVQYVLGEAHFFGLKLTVNPSVLIPRPETEELVGWVLEDEPPSGTHILDAATGSGCIAIALATKLPDATLYGCDVSEGALRTAGANAQAHGVRIHFFQHNLLETVPPDFDFDLIVSNPPYVRELERQWMHVNVRGFEPGLALFVDDADPLIFYRALRGLAHRSLREGGAMYLEINEALAEQTMAVFSGGSDLEVTCRKDLSGRDRMIRVRGFRRGRVWK